MPLHTPTSASLDFWEQHKDDRVLFNVGLVSQDSESPEPVPINALDLAANSEWFRCLVKHLPVLCGTDLGSVTIPCSVSRHILEQGIVRAIYGSSVLLDLGNVEAIYRAADAMQVSMAFIPAASVSAASVVPFKPAVSSDEVTTVTCVCVCQLFGSASGCRSTNRLGPAELF